MEYTFITKENLTEYSKQVKATITSKETALTTKINTAQSTADAAKKAAATAQSTANSKLSSVKSINGVSLVGTGNLELSDIGIDGQIAKIVTELPELSQADRGKIYLVKKTLVGEAANGDNVYIEYVCLDVVTDKQTVAKWEKLGEWQPTVDLSPYAKTSTVTAHTSNTNNPHKVTKEQVGLGSVDNTSDLNKPVSTATKTALDKKVDKVTGKQLSTNDYTTAEKTKLAGLDNYKLSGKQDVDGTSVTISLTKGTATSAGSFTLPSATGSTTNDSGAVKMGKAGVMSTTDKDKLDGIAAGATRVIVDGALSSTSTNAIQNKVVTAAFAGKLSISALVTLTSEQIDELWKNA
mgnify:CR=1 FL=1